MPETRPDLRRRSRRRPLPQSHEARSWIAPSPGEYPLGEAKRLRQLRRALGRRQRRAHRLGAELLEREEQAADDRERLAVLLADPFGVVPVLYEEVERMPVSGQPCRAQDDRASPADKLTQLVRQRGELILAEIEAREHDRVTIYVARDVDVLALHGFYDSIGRFRPPRDGPHIPRWVHPTPGKSGSLEREAPNWRPPAPEATTSIGRIVRPAASLRRP